MLRRVLEGDETPACHMVLCIAAVDPATGTLELSDGWYAAWAKCDAPLQRQLERGRLTVGLKVWGSRHTCSGPSLHASASSSLKPN